MLSRVAKVYLETSFFSACVSTRTSVKSIGWRASSLEWWENEAKEHELFISDEVIAELSNPRFRNSEMALAMVRGLSLLQVTDEVLQLAELLVQERVMPAPARSGDALHVATAIRYGMDVLLTWNVKHLANINKRVHLAIICMRLGLTQPILLTPDLL